MHITKLFTLILLIANLTACVSLPTNEDTLTDADLIRAAEQKEFSPTEGAQQWVIACITVSKWSNPFNVQTSVRRIPCA